MKWMQILSSIVLITAITFVGYFPTQSDFNLIISGMVVAFLAYGYLSFRDVPNLSLIFIVGCIVRCILLFSLPNLSDDIYRFIWDGQLTGMNINPYRFLPSELMAEEVPGLDRGLFENMNSPGYYTIYPPVAQLIFYLSILFGDSIVVSSFIMKAFFLVAEVFTFFGIVRLLEGASKKKSLVSLYFLNPLILIEGIGNLHFEIIMIAFLVWGIYYVIVRKKMVVGGLFFALSIASKLLPLMFLPFFLFHLKGRDRIRFFSMGLLSLLVIFIPIFIGLNFQNFGSSIDLYFQKFEFNGGVYYVLRYLGKVLSGYNLIHYIGPALGIIALSLILKKAFSKREYTLMHFFEFAFYSFLIYLFSATTVHPWYLSIPIMFSVFVRWRFVLLWSLLIIFTYINYSYEPYVENLWIVGAEYLILIVAIGYEWKEYQKSRVIPSDA